MRRVRSLPPPLFEPSSLFAQRQYRFQEAFFSSQCHQAGPKFTQDGMIEAGVSQLQAESILPVQSTPNGIGGLPIRQILHKLENGDQCQSPRGVGWLPAPWIQISKQLILVKCSQGVTKPNVEIALWKSSMHNSDGFCWNFRDRLRFHRHGWPPALYGER